MPDQTDERGTMGPEITKQVVDFVHSHGLKIAAHCTGYAGTREIVDAGGDSVEHGTHIDEETAKMMAEKGVVLVPTLAWRDYVFRASKRHGLSKERVDANEAIRESHRASFQRCIAAGVKIAAGTDAGGGDPMRHGNIVRELEVMVETGLQPMQAIEAATRVAAELVGTIGRRGHHRGGEAGRLHPGRRRPAVGPQGPAQRLGRLPGGQAHPLAPFDRASSLYE